MEAEAYSNEELKKRGEPKELIEARAAYNEAAKAEAIARPDTPSYHAALAVKRKAADDMRKAYHAAMDKLNDPATPNK